MRKKLLILKRLFPLMFIVIILLSGIFCSQPEGNNLNTPKTEAAEIRLTIFYPSVGTIRTLINLRKEGLLSMDRLQVTGVYHEKEWTDYKKSKNFIHENKIDWIQLYALRGEINKHNLFHENPLTQEFRKIYQKSDGIIFFGGADIPPYLYGEKTNFLTSIRTPYRHFLELSFVFHLLGGTQDENFKPFLNETPSMLVVGFCLGAQTLNVGTGGTLVQDIWSEKYGKKYLEEVSKLSREKWHFNPFDALYPQEKLLHYNLHPITVLESGTLHTQMGLNIKSTPYVISSHHQAVEKLGKGMEISATSLDGKIVEAVEHKNYPHLLGLQFHPEFPLIWDKTKKYSLLPQDEKGFNVYSFLKNHPPSLDFHKKIWSWISAKLVEFHQRQK